jgi:hypothetical protein
MEAFADLELVAVLYNDCYGIFSFSDTFLERLNERRVAAGMKGITNLEASRWELRSDPVVVKLYNEMGSAAASGSAAKLGIEWIPKEFLDNIEILEYDGEETVGIPILDVYAHLLREFLEEWKRNSELDVAELDRRYSRVKAKYERYREFVQ